MTATVIDGTAVANGSSFVRDRRSAAAFSRRLRPQAVPGDRPGRRRPRLPHLRADEGEPLPSRGLDSRRHDLPVRYDTAEAVAAGSRPIRGHARRRHPGPAPGSPQIDERAVFEAYRADKDVDGVTMASFASDGFRRARLRVVHPGGHHATSRRLRRSPVPAKRPSWSAAARSSASRSACCSSPATPPSPSATPGPATSPAWSGAADIVVAAVGRPELIRGRLDQAGCRRDRRRLQRRQRRRRRIRRSCRASPLITPVPGGVGPMTIAVLLAQTIQAALASNSN